MCKNFLYKVVVVFFLLVSALPAFAQETSPIAWWSFDESSGEAVYDNAGRIEDALRGNYKHVGGVSGNALRFDGYTTHVVREVDQVPMFEGSFSIEAWVAPQTYPWNWTAVVSHEVDQRGGYFFGVNALGQVGFHIAIEDDWRKCVTDKKISLLQWTHIAGTFEESKGLTVYINGVVAARLSVQGAMTPVGEAVYTPEGKLLPQPKNTLELFLGKSHQKMYPLFTSREPSRKSLSNMVFDGRIDEVKLYDKALTPYDIKNAFALIVPENPQPLSYRTFPSLPENRKEFGAYYTKLDYSETWDELWRAGEYADVVVSFDDSPVKVVFWRGVNYNASYITENKLWMGDQSIELWSGRSGWGSSEHMADKQNRYSHVRIIENNDARVVVHWRYAITNILYGITGEDPETGWGSWADEYFTIYPDRVIVRKQVLWANENIHQWQETIFFNQPGTKPEDNVDIEALTLVNMDGEIHTYSWEDGPPTPYDKPVNANIQMTNLKAKNRPFIIFEPGGEIIEYPWGVRKDWSNFHWRNHWPVSRIPNDSRSVTSIDRPSHTALAEGRPLVVKGEGDSYMSVSLYGLTEQKAGELVPLARSWTNPAELTLNSNGFNSNGYDKYQRAYVLSTSTNSSSSELRLELAGSDENPVINPAIIIKGWEKAGVELFLNGEPVDKGKDFRVGYRQTPQGSDLIVWIDKVTHKSLKLILKPVKR
jgi:hypothetical protein